MNYETRINHFLKELEYLTEKYQIKIEGRSYLTDLKNNEIMGEDLMYIDDCYSCVGTVENKGFYTSN